MKLEEFLEKHDACLEGATWALATGCATIEELWLRDDLKLDWRIWIAIKVLDEKTLRQFACLCVREIWPLLTDNRSRRAVEIAEQYAAGTCTEDNLAAASEAEWDAAWDAAWDARAAWAASRDLEATSTFWQASRTWSRIWLRTSSALVSASFASRRFWSILFLS